MHLVKLAFHHDLLLMELLLLVGLCTIPKMQQDNFLIGSMNHHDWKKASGLNQDLTYAPIWSLLFIETRHSHPNLCLSSNHEFSVNTLYFDWSSRWVSEVERNSCSRRISVRGEKCHGNFRYERRLTFARPAIMDCNPETPNADYRFPPIQRVITIWSSK